MRSRVGPVDHIAAMIAMLSMPLYIGPRLSAMRKSALLPFISGKVTLAHIPVRAGSTAKGITMTPARIIPQLALRLDFAPKRALVTFDDAKNDIAVPIALASVFAGLSPITEKKLSGSSFVSTSIPPARSTEATATISTPINMTAVCTTPIQEMPNIPPKIAINIKNAVNSQVVSVSSTPSKGANMVDAAVAWDE